MIKITRNLEVWWPISVPVPQDGGDAPAQTAKIKLRVPTEKSRREMLAKMTAAAAKNKSAEVAQKWLREHVLDWDEFTDDHDAPLTFSDDALAAALNAMPQLGEAISMAINEISAGKPAAKTSANG